jgi:hypothetical protein
MPRMNFQEVDHTVRLPLLVGGIKGAVRGIEPRTSYTQSKNHTTRPNSQNGKQIDFTPRKLHRDYRID